MIPHRKDYILYHKKFNEEFYLSFSKEIEIYLKNMRLNIQILKEEKFKLKLKKLEEQQNNIYKNRPNMRELYYTDFKKFKQYFIEDLYMDEDPDDIEEIEAEERKKKEKLTNNIIKKKILRN